MPVRVSPTWAITALAIVGVASFVLIALYTPTSVPAEDVVILHQYSRNLAETGRISYIPGGPPAEGATDFLWMLYLAAGIKLHIAPTIAAALMNLLCAWALGLVILRLARQPLKPVLILAVFGALSLFPQVQAALKGFCVLPFVLAIAATVMFALEGKLAATAFSSLLLCLIRPDGVLFAVPLLCLIGLPSAPNRSRAGGIYCAVFLLPGLLYFAWRWHYFGEFLPLPFLVKSNEHRAFGLFVVKSLEAILPYAAFAAIVVALVLGKQALRGTSARLILVLLILPSVFYANMRLDQNLDERFFFFVPVALAILLALHWEAAWQTRRRTVAGISVLVYCVLFAFPAARSLAGNLLNRSEKKRIQALATDLNVPRLRGTMLTTEAGLLPFYSRWIPYDAWGLDTPEYARRIIQPAQVESLHPDLVVIHQTSRHQNCTLSEQPALSTRDWNAMTDNIQTGLAETGSYESWQVPYASAEKEERYERVQHRNRDYLCWYLSRSYAGRDAVGDVLQRYGGVKIAP